MTFAKAVDHVDECARARVIAVVHAVERASAAVAPAVYEGEQKQNDSDTRKLPVKNLKNKPRKTSDIKRVFSRLLRSIELHS